MNSNPLAKPGRNEACPCGSGRKYKHCCADRAAPAGAPGLQQLL
ncbi:SEC-C metal-binding domain-containing protein, partial [Methylomonas koyamae]